MRKSKKILVGIIFLLIITAIVFGFVILSKKEDTKPTDNTIVSDSNSIEVKTKDIVITEGESIKVEDFIESCTSSDNECSYKVLKDEEEIDLSKLTVGSYELTLIVNNEERKTVTLNINPKEESETTQNENDSPSSSSSNSSNSNSSDSSNKNNSNNSSTSSNSSSSNKSNSSSSTSSSSSSSSNKNNSSSSSSSSSSSNNSSNSTSSGSTSNTCTNYYVTTTYGTYEGSQILAFYKKFDSPITWQEYESYRKTVDLMSILLDEVNRMPYIEDGSVEYGGRTKGSFEPAYCENGKIIGAVLVTEYLPAYWINQSTGDWNNDKRQGLAFISGKKAYWLYKNFTPVY